MTLTLKKEKVDAVWKESGIWDHELYGSESVRAKVVIFTNLTTLEQLKRPKTSPELIKSLFKVGQS